MATSGEYEAALAKAERQGVNGLNRIERELVEKLTREPGARGNRARNVIK